MRQDLRRQTNACSSRAGERRFCSRNCFDVARRNRVEQICEYCGQTFGVTPAHAEDGGRQFCSKACCDKSRLKRVACVCLMCGKQFELEYSRIEEGRGRFCSKRCSLRYAGESSIEQLIREELERRKEPYESQVKISRYYVDFVLPQRMIAIECDGNYWHRLFDVKRNQRKNECLISLGYQVFRFTESEIRNSPSACIDRALNGIITE